jgi:hypothetical protein
MAGKRNLKTSESLEDKFKQRLLELGLLAEITPPLPPEKYPRDRQPIPVQDNSVSDLMIRERR